MLFGDFTVLEGHRTLVFSHLELYESALRTAPLKTSVNNAPWISTGNDYRRASGGDAIALQQRHRQMFKKSN